jgi:sugar (pentulose or hexulose) kinase
VLGSLNSGMQLYRLKHEQPDLFNKIRSSLHLPQYLNYILSGKISTDITSVGCHTNLWNFRLNAYHEWVQSEQIGSRFAPVVLGDALVNDPATSRQPPIGVGLHDSSAALIPYLLHFKDPFILISTGTWCISMNPFNKDPLTRAELRNDCLCYLTFKGEPVKSSRLFAGNEHEKQIKKLGDFFHQDDAAHSRIRFNNEIYEALLLKYPSDPAVHSKSSVGDDLSHHPNSLGGASAFSSRELSEFKDYETAYHQLMRDIMVQQVALTRLVMNDPNVKHIFVDGGFSKNDVYMNLLSMAFPKISVAAATVPQSTGLGAALAIHQYWNPEPLPDNIIQLKTYPPNLT